MSKYGNEDSLFATDLKVLAAAFSSLESIREVPVKRTIALRCERSVLEEKLEER